MVSAVRAGESMRSVARRFRVSLHTVQRWVERAGSQRLDRVDWHDHQTGPRHCPHRTSQSMEDRVLALRAHLRAESELGEYGAAAIRDALEADGETSVPSLRTINRILDRRGAFDSQRRPRRTPPPRGWYLPDVADRRSELDYFDVVLGLVIQGGPEVEVLNAISLHGGLTDSWPTRTANTEFAKQAIIAHWKQHGLPVYAQFDNDTRFQGAHQHKDVI